MWSNYTLNWPNDLSFLGSYNYSLYHHCGEADNYQYRSVYGWGATYVTCSNRNGYDDGDYFDNFTLEFRTTQASAVYSRISQVVNRIKSFRMLEMGYTYSISRKVINANGTFFLYTTAGYTTLGYTRLDFTF